MIAYKFLRSGRVGPFSGFPWPEPDVRVHTATEVAVCRRGIHACRPGDLPWWLADELWEIELDGPVQVEEHKIVAAAGRLRSRIEAWTPACAQEYAYACAWRAQGGAVAARRLADEIPETRISLTIAGDGAVRALTGAPPTSAYIAAHAEMRADGPAGYAAERAWQSQWLVDRLGLRTDSDACNGTDAPGTYRT